MILKRIEQTEAQIFIKKFFTKENKKPLSISSTPDGKIIEVITDNKDIIAYVKQLGLS